MIDEKIIIVIYWRKAFVELFSEFSFYLSFRFDADISRSMEGKLTDAGQKYTIFGEWIKDYLGAIELFYY